MTIRILVSLVLRLHWALAGSADEMRIAPLVLASARFEIETPAAQVDEANGGSAVVLRA